MNASGWIGVDLDGTLAHYDGPKGPDHIGAPIMAMVNRVKTWLAAGKAVKIFTARVGAQGGTSAEGNTDDEAFAAKQRILISQWCQTHIGQALEVTATKDFAMIELWDDRAVQVVPNTGIPFDLSRAL